MLVQIEEFIINNLQLIFDQIGWLGVTALLVFENATGITPSEIILGLAGWMLIEAHGVPFTGVFLWGLVAAFGSTLGSSLMYWAARAGGRPMVEKILRWFRIDAQQIQRVESMFQKWGLGFVLFGRMVPGVRTLINIPAGMTRMPFWRFVLYTFIGAYIWCTLLLSLGYFLGHEWWLISEYLNLAAPWLLAAAALGLVIAIAWRWSKKQRVPSRNLN
jgi:membrane protein DedA with SNARE-associated domain